MRQNWITGEEEIKGRNVMVLCISYGPLIRTRFTVKFKLDAFVSCISGGWALRIIS